MKKIACLLLSLGWALTVAAQEGQPLPEVSLRDLNGAVVKTTQFAKGGKITLVVLWATWCGPSITALDKISKLNEKWKDKDVVVMAVNTDDARTRAKVKPLAIQHGWTFTGVFDDKLEFQQKVNPAKTCPFIQVADRTGKIVYVRSGYNEGDERQLEEAVNALLTKNK